jgi:hypothetical protein
VRTWRETKLQSEWELISGHVGRIREKLETIRRRMGPADPPECSDALEVAQLADRLAAFEAEERAIGGRLDLVRDDRQRRQAKARPRLAAAQSAYDDLIGRLETRSQELAALRAEAEEAGRHVLAMKEAVGVRGAEALIPTRITVWKNGDPLRGRDWLVEWRR